MENQIYHYFYKITNNINNHFYYGIHTTSNLNDGYMGSGTALRRAFKNYGIENFSKEIIKFFDSREELELYEAKIVNRDLLANNTCYNIALGGKSPNTIDTVSVIDKNGKCFRVHKNDPRYLDGSLVSVSKGYLTAYNKDTDEYVFITKDEYKNNRDKYLANGAGKILVYDKNGKLFQIELEEFYKNKNNYIAFSANKVVVKDKNNKNFLVSLSDERYISGELVPIWKDKKHTKETIQKIKKHFSNIKHQQGEKNSQYGTCWMNNGIENIKVKKDDINEHLDKGYVLGRFIKNKEKMIEKNKNRAWLNKNGKSSFINKDLLYEYIKDGWFYGRVKSLDKRIIKSDSFKLYNKIYNEIYGEDYPLLTELNMKRG